MKKTRLVSGLQEEASLAMISRDYAKLREKYVVGKWQLPEGCKNIEEFDQMIAEWWKEYDRTKIGYLERKILEMTKEDLPRNVQGGYPQDEGDLSFIDYETCIVRCLEECERVASRFGLAKRILLRSLFLPEETIRSMDKLDPSELISYEIVPRVPIYQDSPLATRVIKAAKESNEVREALGHFKFTPRVREFIKGVEVLDKAQPSVGSAQAETGSIAGSAKEWRELQSLPERVKKLEEIAKTLSALATSYQFEKGNEYLAWCAKCDNQVIVEKARDKKTKKFYYRCSQCGTPIAYVKYLDGPLADIFSEET